MEILSDSSSDMESSKIPEIPENPNLDKSVANESLRSMYSTNKIEPDDIMVIDTVGDRPEEQLPPPQSTPIPVKVTASTFFHVLIFKLLSLLEKNCQAKES